MEKESYNKPMVTSENVEIGIYGRYDECVPGQTCD
ncbi:hypothetical protein BMS3Bbin16_01009 [archaeon BMS3Bbin16]|nr:hypothetical protein BMS3Bbin16_01009 [archaeon BMS3Bbin16]